MMMLVAWGRGEDGQLGLGDSHDQFMPRIVEGLQYKEILKVSCGSGHTLVLTKDGDVYSWGRGDDGRLGHGDHIWMSSPMRIEFFRNMSISRIACGSYHCVATTNDGELYSWGGGMHGKLGHGNETGVSKPKRVEALKSYFVKDAACGSKYTLALCHDRNAILQKNETLFSWGDNTCGVTGLGEKQGHQYIPKAIHNLQNETIVSLAACGFHSAVITGSGKVYTWGEGKFGRLGHGNEENLFEPTPVTHEIFKTRKLVQVACGGFHTVVLSDGGDIFTWGGGEHGQLGLNSRKNQLSPCFVESLLNLCVSRISCGWSHSVALLNDGSLYAWGNGDHGKLGHGNEEKLLIPKKIAGLSNKFVLDVTSYNEHCAAIVTERCSTEPETLVTELGVCLNDRFLSDIEFQVEDQIIYCHRIILAARSQHFKAMFSSGMIESTARVIEIHHARYSIFYALVQYIYTGKVEISCDVNDIGDVFELFGLADSYAIDSLCDICKRMILAKLSDDSAPALLTFADHFGIIALKDVLIRYIASRLSSIKKSAAFSSLSRELIVDIVRSAET